MQLCDLNFIVVPALAGFFFCAPLGAQPAKPLTEQSSESASADETPVPAQSALETQYGFRESKTISLVGNYGLYSFLVPGKKGAQLNWIKSATSSWEFDYFSGDYGLEKFGVNLLSFSERVVLLKYRKYWKSTFNLGTGIGERRYSFEFGSRLLEKIPGDVVNSEKLVELTRYVFDVSLGNRWHFKKGLVVSFDWLDLALPFGPERQEAGILDRIEDESDKRDTKKVIDFLNNLPTVSVLKLGIGYAL